MNYWKTQNSRETNSRASFTFTAIQNWMLRSRKVNKDLEHGWTSNPFMCLKCLSFRLESLCWYERYMDATLFKWNRFSGHNFLNLIIAIGLHGFTWLRKLDGRTKRRSPWNAPKSFFKKNKMALRSFHRNHREICTRNRPIFETRFLDNLGGLFFLPGLFSSLLKIRNSRYWVMASI